LIEPNTGWLRVAHVDEYMAFIPSGTAANNQADGAWRLAAADTGRATELMASLDREATGVATAGALGRLTDANATWSANEWQNGVLIITAGTGQGQTLRIAGNNRTEITILGTWAAVPDATSGYRLIPATAFATLFAPLTTQDHGVATGSTLNTLTDGRRGLAGLPNWVADRFRNGYVRIVQGKGVGQIRRVTSNTANRLTVATNWADAPDITSVYVVVTGSRLWNNGEPAVVTVLDLLHNTNLATLDLGGAGDASFTNVRDKQALFQALLDEGIGLVRDEVGLADADIIKLPQWYLGEMNGADIALRSSAAYWPGVVNLQPWNRTILVPEPFGPRNAAGDDVFKLEITTRLAALGLTAEFVDTWQEYHILDGETHCGTNVRRTPPMSMRRWWLDWPVP
jgi:protein-arginine deiminase